MISGSFDCSGELTQASQIADSFVSALARQLEKWQGNVFLDEACVANLPCALMICQTARAL